MEGGSLGRTVSLPAHRNDSRTSCPRASSRSLFQPSLAFALPSLKHSRQVLINDERLQNEGPEHPSAGGHLDRGPAHAYQLPVRITDRDSTPNGGAANSSGGGNSLASQAEERLPMRLRGIRAAYGRALGTAGKLCLDKHASTVGGHPESAAQAWEHLTKAAEVIMHYKGRRCRLLQAAPGVLSPRGPCRGLHETRLLIVVTSLDLHPETVSVSRRRGRGGERA